MVSKLGLAGCLLVAALSIYGSDAKPATESSKMTDAKNDKFPEEDSDMLMEPNDFSPVSVIRSQGRQYFPSTTDFYHEEPPNTEIDPPHAAQNFYPSFYRDSPPLGHSRPYFPPPHPLDGPIPTPQKFAAPIPTRGFDPAILGSGDFGVIRGGTFYPEDEMPYHPEENSEFNQFYGENANNGHGRPQSDELVQKFTYPEEQFANFRDFADINTPADSAFSQFVVVYAAKNATTPTAQHPRPKNIFEQLELLDKEKALEEKKNRTSKSKVKLTSTKLEKKYKKKTAPKDLDYEPLLALS
ncbi:uncharacterized protein LOC129947542 [Eupeodes corollae]|uniref:uncharacterized protein LOC129947542 n=1 Tax=Eupeodes corollae TaxID=290404 RepID=UPI002490E3BD|nr:uncharacterized protein LOC129947542 [Eupeodes corollae]